MIQEKLEEARKLYQTANTDQKYVLESLFPELKESENERTRKEFCEDIWNYIPYEKAHKYITWLEKQSEKDEEILILKDQIESLHAAIKAIKETHRIELEKQGEKKSSWSKEDEQYLLVCKNALAKYQTTDKWDANIIYNWLKNKLQKL